MKQILLVTSALAALMLSGCAVAPSMPGNNIAGIGSGGIQASRTPTSIYTANGQTTMPAGSPNSTGSIVPLNDEGAVVDLPDSSARKQAFSTLQGGQTSVVEGDAFVREGDQASSSAERHRRELINRGDLREGQPLPVE